MARWMAVALGVAWLAGPASAGTVLLPDVPSYIWYNGCGPTAASMILGYWDAHGLGSLVTAGDGTNSWTTNQAAVKDMIASPGHIRDYAPTPDRVATPGDPYHPDDSVGDFMWTSRDPLNWGDSYESTQYLALTDYSGWSGYGSLVGYYTYFGPAWSTFVEEINAGRPAEFFIDLNADGVPDHFVPAIGYDDTPGALRYAYFNTYDHTVRWTSFTQVMSGTANGIRSATFFNPYLSVVGDTLVLAADGTLDLNAGAGATGAITASLTNNGTVNVNATTGISGAGGTYTNNGMLTVAGGATLTIDGLTSWTGGTIGGAGQVELTGGLNISGSVSKAGGGTMTVSGPQGHAVGAALDVQAGTLRLDSDGGGGGGGANLTVQVSGTAAAAFGVTQHLAELNLNDSATAVLDAGGGMMLYTAALAVADDGAGHFTAGLDLNDNGLELDYGAGPSPFAAIQDMVISGYNGGAWDGGGICSSVAAATGLALGYADGAEGVVDGLAGDTILVKYALPGDVNMDGVVEGSDVDYLLGYYGTGDKWTSADISYDGKVDGSDVDLFLGYFGSTGPLVVGPRGGLGGEPVPEPGTLLLLAAGAVAGWLIRRGRAGR